MKITKRQLRRIIKEAHPDYEGLPQSDIDYYELADDYALWVEDFGQGAENPKHPGVMASYFLEKGLEDDHAKHEMLGKAFQVSHADIMKELELQAADQKAAEEILSTRIGNYSSSPYAKKTNEGKKMKITKRQLRRIIKEERAKLLHENLGGHSQPHGGIGGISQALIDDYNSWVSENGHVTPAASSVMASYFVERGMEEDRNALDVMAGFFKLDSTDVARDIKRQQAEKAAVMGEGTDPEDMPSAWRQILGNCLGNNK